MLKLPRALKDHFETRNDICLNREARLCSDLIMVCAAILITSTLLTVTILLSGAMIPRFTCVVWLALFSGITLVLQLISKKHSGFFTYLLGGFMFCFSAYLLYTGGMSVLSPICVLLFPHVGSLVASPKQSIMISSLLMIIVTVMLLTPVYGLLQASYSLDFRILYSIMMLFSFAMICYAERSRYKMRERAASMAKELQLMAYRDQLTKSYNRHALISHFGNLHNDAAGYSFALLDLDDFKKINDTYGHFVGDDVLCHISAVIQTQLPFDGYLYRWGGEEFLIVIWDISPKDFIALLESIRNVIYATPLLQDGSPIHITSSFGAMCATAGMSIQSCLMVADKQLYYAKKNGKNQVAFLKAS